MNRRGALHVLVGVVVSAVGTPLLGGGMTAYLEGSDLRRGVFVGLGVGFLVGVAYALWFLQNIYRYSPPSVDFVSQVARLSSPFLQISVTVLVFSTVLGGIGGLIGGYVVSIRDART